MIIPKLRDVFLWGGFVCALGCAGTLPEAVLSASAVREEFDPQTLNDEDFLLKLPDSGSTTTLQPPAERPAGPLKQVDGYRVQIAAVLDRVRAETFRAETEGKFDAPVYIHYDEDTYLYKIQVGNSRTSGEAALLRKTAKDRGYREAFVVHARIEVAAAPVRRPATVLGFRIQIFLAPSQQAAEQAQEQARNLLGREDVYIEFEPPFFKVRIGNFRKRKEAEEFLKIVKKHGYDTPFPIETQISVPPE